MKMDKTFKDQSNKESNSESSFSLVMEPVYIGHERRKCSNRVPIVYHRCIIRSKEYGNSLLGTKVVNKLLFRRLLPKQSSSEGSSQSGSQNTTDSVHRNAERFRNPSTFANCNPTSGRTRNSDWPRPKATSEVRGLIRNGLFVDRMADKFIVSRKSSRSALTCSLMKARESKQTSSMDSSFTSLAKLHTSNKTRPRNTRINLQDLEKQKIYEARKAALKKEISLDDAISVKTGVEVNASESSSRTYIDCRKNILEGRKTVRRGAQKSKSEWSSLGLNGTCGKTIDILKRIPLKGCKTDVPLSSSKSEKVGVTLNRPCRNENSSTLLLSLNGSKARIGTPVKNTSSIVTPNFNTDSRNFDGVGTKAISSKVDAPYFSCNTNRVVCEGAKLDKSTSVNSIDKMPVDRRDINGRNILLKSKSERYGLNWKTSFGKDGNSSKFISPEGKITEKLVLEKNKRLRDGVALYDSFKTDNKKKLKPALHASQGTTFNRIGCQEFPHDVRSESGFPAVKKGNKAKKLQSLDTPPGLPKLTKPASALTNTGGDVEESLKKWKEKEDVNEPLKELKKDNEGAEPDKFSPAERTKPLLLRILSYLFHSLAPRKPRVVDAACSNTNLLVYDAKKIEEHLKEINCNFLSCDAFFELLPGIKAGEVKRMQ